MNFLSLVKNFASLCHRYTQFLLKHSCNRIASIFRGRIATDVTTARTVNGDVDVLAANGTDVAFTNSTARNVASVRDSDTIVGTNFVPTPGVVVVSIVSTASQRPKPHFGKIGRIG